jgi:hypothetical protein
VVQQARYLVEFGSHDGTSEITVRLSTGIGYQTSAGESPSRAKYLPLVKDAGNVNSFLFKNGSTIGSSNTGIGRVRLNNADGSLDYLEDRGLGGFEIDIREEQGTSYPNDFPVVVAGAIDFAEFSSLVTDLIIKDRTSIFRDLQYQPHKYGGDNNGTTIELEGTANDIGGLPKPVLVGGVTRNISPIMVNEAKEIYQVSSEPIAELPSVMVGRSAVTVDTVHTSLTSFLTDTVTAGQYNVYFGDYKASDGDNQRGCYIMMGTTPSHPLTVDAIEGWKNISLYSEDMGNAVWDDNGHALTLNNAVAPDGNMTADTSPLITANSRRIEQTITVVASTDYTLSFWAQKSSGDGDTPKIRVYDNSNAATIIANQDYTVTGEWQRFEANFTTPVGCTSIGIFPYRGRTGDDVAINIWGVQLEERNFKGPYTKTTSSEVYNNHIPALIWKVMNKKGYVLDEESIAYAQAQFPYDAQTWQDTNETLTGNILDLIKDSALFYITTQLTGEYIIKRLELPTSAESVRTYDNTQILGGVGTPKIKKIASRDSHKGVPVHNVNIRYEENYTIMGKQDLTGVADTTDELAFVSNKYRSTNDTDNTVKTQYPSSPEMTKDTKLVDKTGADVQAADDLTIFKVRRPIIEIKVPVEFTTKTDGTLIEKGDVITVEGKHYRIIGQKIRLPSSNRNDVTSSAVVYQAWGGVS